MRNFLVSIGRRQNNLVSLSTQRYVAPAFNSVSHIILLNGSSRNLRQIRLFSDEKPNNSETGDNANKKKDEASEKNVSEMVSKEEFENVSKQLSDTKDQLYRLAAEQDNFRKRMLKDQEDTRHFAVQSFAKQLLDVSDNLKRALSAVPEDLLKTESEDEITKALKVLHEGVELTRKELVKVFEKQKIIEFGAVGDKFDPHVHNALFNIPSNGDETKKGTVGQIMKTGYKLHDRIIRPADVGTFQ